MNECDITLVNISTPLPSNGGEKPNVYAPLGCLYLISSLERAGFRVDFRDYQLYAADAPDPLDIDLLCTFLEEPAPVVGFSCMVSMLPFVMLGTRRFKELHPSCTVVLGGPGPSGVAERIISAWPWIDVVVKGEGEETLVELLTVLRTDGDRGAVPGISYREGPRTCKTVARSRIRDLDGIPMPAYDRIDLSRYTCVSVVTGRGCPYRCTFCDVGPLWGNKTVMRSVGSVMDELTLLRDRFGQHTIHVADDTFDLARGRTEEFCDRIKELELRWSCLARIDLMDEALIERMAGAGCDAVFLGIESGSDAVLRKIKKKFTIEEATVKAEMSTRYMDRVITSYIWGFPFETMEDFKLTLLSVVSMWHLGAMAGLKLLSPMPLSQLGIRYRDRLAFSEDLCSVFASLGNMVPGETEKRAALPSAFKDCIREYPDIFSGFYYIECDGIEDKVEYLKRFSRRVGVPA